MDIQAEDAPENVENRRFPKLYTYSHSLLLLRLRGLINFIYILHRKEQPLNREFFVMHKPYHL